MAAGIQFENTYYALGELLPLISRKEVTTEDIKKIFISAIRCFSLLRASHHSKSMYNVALLYRDNRPIFHRVMDDCHISETVRAAAISAFDKALAAPASASLLPKEVDIVAVVATSAVDTTRSTESEIKDPFLRLYKK